MNDFQDSNLETIFGELVENERTLSAIGRNIHEFGKVAVNARADYENAKNQTLIRLYEEEADKAKKRTVADREAIYRTEHKDLRLAAYLAENNLRSEQDLLKIALAKINACQTRARILEAEIKLTR